ncbi:EamA family transporter RarD [Marinicauda salina]|uniref:EamA family transporter RarD n=1 Tax=Marinicauda salina TaxID=2135793 RepID=A0A2U2BW39_9PROT|nr:EamA family transporter RarD [Marinicauda salina]PWE18236.1 EamA family transporter RarD [Marinicauda salina]
MASRESAPAADPAASGRLDPGRAGAAALAGYAIWGVSPIFYKFLGFASAAEIVLQRGVWSALTLLGLLLIAAKTREAARLVRDPRTMGLLVLSTALISANWWLFIYSVNSGQVLSVSLGYYINPLMNVAVGVFVARERFGPLRVAAVGLAALGVINQIVVVGELPWISLVLAASFTLYGYVRKTIAVDGRIGLFWETTIIAIPSLIAIGFLETGGLFGAEGHFTDGPGRAALLVLTGPMTVAPLLLFIIGARGLHFATLGVLQFVAPSLQFGVGLLYGEPFSPAHLVTFALIWTGLAVFVADLLRFRAKSRRPA